MRTRRIVCGMHVNLGDPEEESETTESMGATLWAYCPCAGTIMF